MDIFISHFPKHLKYMVFENVHLKYMVYENIHLMYMVYENGL